MRKLIISLKLYQNIDRLRYSRSSEKHKCKYLLYDDCAYIT